MQSRAGQNTARTPNKKGEIHLTVTDIDFLGALVGCLNLESGPLNTARKCSTVTHSKPLFVVI